jgi:hypothetical protein
MTDVSFYMTSGAGIAVIAGLVYAAKRAGVATHYLPLCSVIIGIVYGVAAFTLNGLSVQFGAIWGLLLATTSSTGYDMAKGVQKMRKKK